MQSMNLKYLRGDEWCSLMAVSTCLNKAMKIFSQTICFNKIVNKLHGGPYLQSVFL